MNAYRNLTLAALVATVLAVLTPNARAQMLEEKMRVTFSGPVEVPGEVLPAGTYTFEALENGHLTRILSADEKHVDATLLTIPDEQMEPMENRPSSSVRVRTVRQKGLNRGSTQATLSAMSSSIRGPIQARISHQSWTHSPEEPVALRQIQPKASRCLRGSWVSMPSMLG